MKPMIVFAVLALASTALSEVAHAQEYNLRTVPSTPQTGAPFVAAFESTDCEAWVLPPLGEPPVVTVQGSTVRLEVDRITIANCSYPTETNTLSVAALPIGAYQLELIARAYQSPGNDILAQAVAFQVGPAGTATGTHSIPTTSTVGLMVFAGLMACLGYAVFRRAE